MNDQEMVNRLMRVSFTLTLEEAEARVQAIHDIKAATLRDLDDLFRLLNDPYKPPEMKSRACVNVVRALSDQVVQLGRDYGLVTK